MKPPRMWDEERSSPWLLALYAAITLRWGSVQLLAILAISPKHASVIHAALVFQL